MANVLPFRALRYSPETDLAAAICPPFDIISSEQQQALHERAAYNAVHVELALGEGDSRYEAAAAALSAWRNDGTLRKDASPAYYLYEQQFEHGGTTYKRHMLFARVGLQPWSDGVVLPHEQTFGAPKADRLKLLQATRINSSPLFLIYRDRKKSVDSILQRVAKTDPGVSFIADDGQRHSLWVIDGADDTVALRTAFVHEKLYIADGHHRYETALGFRDDARSNGATWSGNEPENFAMVALSSASDSGLLVLPIHRVTAAGDRWNDVSERVRALFTIEQLGSLDDLNEALKTSVPNAVGLLAADESGPLLLTPADASAIDGILPQDRSPAWRRLDYAIANHVIMRHCLGLSEAQMTDHSSVWFTEDAAEAERQVRAGRARYAVILNPVPVDDVLDLAETGERMPQKSTFFFPKVPTGLLFNQIED
ncbi:MAG: DUF1015 domain-containing protein [Chloroflexi bacterium]|nr:DUF1015 domain-containing protein [Chloroflexota bacterium]